MPNAPEKLPWYDYMKVGMGLLGIRPSDFWDLTFIEYWAIYNAKYGNKEEPPTRAELFKQMMERPD